MHAELPDLQTDHAPHVYPCSLSLLLPPCISQGQDQFFPQLLRASHHYTTNANEADFFYVDAWTTWEPFPIRHIIKELEVTKPGSRMHAEHSFLTSVAFSRL